MVPSEAARRVRSVLLLRFLVKAVIFPLCLHSVGDCVPISTFYKDAVILDWGSALRLYADSGIFNQCAARISKT